MLEELIELDKKSMIFLNSFHSPLLDPVMFVITKTIFWIPLYLILIYVLFKHLNKDAWFVLVGAAITILLSDQITSTLLKPWIARLRPSQDPSLVGIIHLVEGYKGGLYGFASSHAANTFGVALLIWLTLKNHVKWIWVIFIWAFIMTYSRIYLGVHYPGDILVGAMIGLFFGWVGFRISLILRNRKRSELNEALNL
jgi:undecaprenyl-diphosphatase